MRHEGLFWSTSVRRKHYECNVVVVQRSPAPYLTRAVLLWTRLDRKCHFLHKAEKRRRHWIPKVLYSNSTYLPLKVYQKHLNTKVRPLLAQLHHWFSDINFCSTVCVERKSDEWFGVADEERINSTRDRRVRKPQRSSKMHILCSATLRCVWIQVIALFRLKLRHALKQNIQTTQLHQNTLDRAGHRATKFLKEWMPHYFKQLTRLPWYKWMFYWGWSCWCGNDGVSKLSPISGATCNQWSNAPARMISTRLKRLLTNPFPTNICHAFRLIYSLSNCWRTRDKSCSVRTLKPGDIQIICNFSLSNFTVHIRSMNASFASSGVWRVNFSFHYLLDIC